MTAARDGRPQLPPASSRQGTAGRRRAGQRPGGAGRGVRVAVPGLRAEGTRAPRDAPRGRACAAPSPRRPLPRPVTHEGRWGAGPSSESFGPRSGRSCEVPGNWRGWVARSQRDATVGLFKWCQASPGLFSLHRPATPAMRRNLRAGKEFSISPASLFYRFFWHAQSHIHSV